jgi:histidinol dehydrogenase
VFDFLKRSSIIGYDAGAVRATGQHATALATAEGLDAHRLSVQVRRDEP